MGGDVGEIGDEIGRPFAKLTREALVIEGEPAFVNDQQRRSAVETILYAMEEIGEHGGRGARADQSFGFERLDRCLAKIFGFGVEQAPVRAADAVGPERLLEIVGLQQD